MAGNSHTAVHNFGPERWVMLASHSSTKRLIVFVHGFGGKSLSTWREFPDSGLRGQWWAESDMLFVGYKSLNDGIQAVADRIIQSMPRFYPEPCRSALIFDDEPVRTDISTHYSELILVGHSLGGVILRLALVESAHEWDTNLRQVDKKPVLLESELRLFSPASGGFQASGWPGLLRASSFWPVFNLWLRKAQTFNEMQVDSPLLGEIRRRTETFANQTGMDALRARIIWASPEHVVITSRYDTDVFGRSIDKRDHRSVCKPNLEDNYTVPWLFVELGEVFG